MIYLLYKILDIYYYLIIIRIILSWFPINWSIFPFNILDKLTAPYLNIFRRLIPSIERSESPILALLVFYIIQYIIIKIIEIIHYYTSGKK